jgi:membrane associated rhomboid family serine protease
MNSLRYQWNIADTATRLIMVNAAVYIIVNVPAAVLHLMGYTGFGSWINTYLTLPGAVGELIFKPWTLISHLFIHSGLFHLFFNMLTLYFTGQLFIRYFNRIQFLNLYFTAGLAGAVFFIVSVNLFPLFSLGAIHYTATGASAAILGVLIGVATYRPNDSVFLFGAFRLELRWLALILILLDVVQIPQGNAGGHLAHLGGAFWGFLWARNLSKGRDISSFLSPVWQWMEQRHRSPLKVKYRAATNPKQTEAANSPKNKQAEIDALLDKISRSGYDSLSQREKERLFELTKDQ